MPERAKVAISMLIIVGSGAFLSFWGYRGMRFDDRMFEARSQPIWPVWLGLGGLVVGVLLLIFWGRRRPDATSRDQLSQRESR